MLIELWLENNTWKRSRKMCHTLRQHCRNQGLDEREVLFHVCAICEVQIWWTQMLPSTNRQKIEPLHLCLRARAREVLSRYYFYGLLSSLVAQIVKNLPATQETPIQFLGQEDPLEKEMATCYSILVCRIPWTEEPGGLHGVRVRHDWVTNTHTHTHTHTHTEFPLIWRNPPFALF